MLNTEGAILRKLIFHRVSQDEASSAISKELTALDDQEQVDVLRKVLLAPFNPGLVTSEFYHPIDIELNVLFKISRNIYDGKDFKARSKEIFRHLQEVSKHPGIKDGDLFISKFDDIKLNNKYYEAIGIYKIESQETFIEVVHTNDASKLMIKKGITERKVDKACLIIFDKEPYTVLVVDKASTDAAYWIDDFIKVVAKNDDSNNTKNVLDIAKRFISEQIPVEFETTKKDQIEYLSRAADYFKSNEIFSKKSFENDVFHFPEVIKSFKAFDKKLRQENDLVETESFNISKDVVKKQLKGYKSIIKLDRNFHIYIHGDNSLIEKGYDNSKKMNYYKVYFDSES